MTNAERYYTDELRKKKEIINAEERQLRRSRNFYECCGICVEAFRSVGKNAQVLAEIDLFSSWGSIMRDRDYCMPEFIEDSKNLEIIQVGIQLLR